MTDNMSSITMDTELDGDFSSLNLPEISPRKKSEKQPKKILHFSDGILEEYSSEEEDNEDKEDSKSLVDPKTLQWGPWLQYYASKSGKSMLDSCDYVGEGIANFLGITSQKYFYEIEEYKRSMQEEVDEKQEEAAQMAGWTTTAKMNLGESHTSEQFKIKKNFEDDIPPKVEDADENIKF